MPSYSPVFSQGFIYYANETPNNQFEVPAGYTAVIRDASYYEEAGVGTAQIYVQNNAEAPGITVMTLTVAGLVTQAISSRRIVVPGEGIITLYTDGLGTGPQVYVGGYLLRNALT